MKMRMPAYPLLLNDPYFNVWSMGDRLNGENTKHWTGKENKMVGYLRTAGETLCFLGDEPDCPKMEQTSVDVTALSTVYTFEYGAIKLKVTFTSPLIPDDIELLSRPVSYIFAEVEGVERATLDISVCEQLCLDSAKQYPVVSEPLGFAVRMGSTEQPVLKKSGDDIRIDYGYVYIASTDAGSGTYTLGKDDMSYIGCTVPFSDGKALIAVAYDDIYSLEYFGKPCRSIWNKDGQEILDVIKTALSEYAQIKARCDLFDKKLEADATAAGGTAYYELLAASFRQVMAAHKAVCSPDGEVLWISKECFSNGCAATVDVTYPSAPMFMYYNPELLRGMLRPVFKYAESDAWEYDFAPHDVGTYPLVNGQTYFECKREYQMPVEECGNMLVLVGALARLDDDTDFLKKHKATLDVWAKYLMGCGFDPENQLCTDDFAGHLAHNCNLSLKAICALGAYAGICDKLGDGEFAAACRKSAADMADRWCAAADNGDGSYRLAFDKPDTFSMKYNLVWDGVMKLGLFDTKVAQIETASYDRHIKKYGMPLDNRAMYTKSDWLVWCAAMIDSVSGFEAFIKPLWDMYNETPDRAPMTDWYDADTGRKQMFQNRTVLGGFWIRLLDKSGKLAD